MKIFVKTLKGDRFEIQVNLEDSVADVKKNIEIVLGVAPAEQVLIHKGKVLKDETTLEANKVSEKSIIGVMKAHAPPPSSTPVASVATSATTASETPSLYTGLDLNFQSISESNIQQILQMAGGGLSRDRVVTALCLAYNDLDKALEYLYFDLPEQIEDPFIIAGETHQEPDPPTVADLERLLYFEGFTQEYEYLRAMARSDPSIVKDYVEMLEEKDPPSFHLIQHNKSVFLRLLLEGGIGGNEMEQPQARQAVQTNEPNNGGDGGNQVGGSNETEVEQPPQELQADQTNKPNNGGGDGNQVEESKETEVEFATPEDSELIERLEALGFERGDAEVAYFACNKNVQDAADHLLGYKHEPRRE